MEDGKIIIVLLFKKLLVEKVGFKFNDEIISINGELMVGKDLNYVVLKIRGKKGFSVLMKI